MIFQTKETLERALWSNSPPSIRKNKLCCLSTLTKAKGAVEGERVAIITWQGVWSTAWDFAANSRRLITQLETQKELKQNPLRRYGAIKLCKNQQVSATQFLLFSVWAPGWPFSQSNRWKWGTIINVISWLRSAFSGWRHGGVKRIQYREPYFSDQFDAWLKINHFEIGEFSRWIICFKRALHLRAVSYNDDLFFYFQNTYF